MSILKQSLYALYANDYDVLNMLDQISFENLDYKFNQELYARMSKEDCAVAQAILASSLVKRYDEAVNQACLSCTNELAKIMSLLIIEREGKLN